ncbi:2-dehydropantoate 2-reductase [Parendozoicomonas sp. Alg238-R29]|uniref:2-dehydropantoate 2-reductase n=1 Tax=Parendozoicomonas sp. Alg238-R29 TaxID=2993446 RepID=UPI00248DA9E0|nr:2-dehydropantoate 2-reductase [Parendozoicomonas sp. Alg238-R29]
MITLTVFGAGCIGCHLAGELLRYANPEQFTLNLIGRPNLKEDTNKYGLTISDYAGNNHNLSPKSFSVSTSPETLQNSDIIFLCVKSGQTEEAAKQILTYKPNTTVISMQNGVRNASRLRKLLPNANIVAGMVPYNVVALPNARFHKATEGHIYLEENVALNPIKNLLKQAFQPCWFSDLGSVQYSKLLLNLNNPINALSDLPLKQELETRKYRLQLAECIREGLEVYKAAGINTVKIGKVPVSWLPILLSAPDFLFKKLASAMLKIDPEARSSMWHDLQKKRVTEIDDLNGEIINLGQKHNITTPANSRIYQQIKQSEQLFQ